MNRELPLKLYKANTKLQLRIGRLLQENAGEWLDAARQLNSEDWSDAHSQMGQLLEATDWQAVATLSGQVLRQVFEEQLSLAQMWQQLAARNQVIFAVGLRRAWSEWQQTVMDVTGSHSDAGSEQPAERASTAV